jgi:hypothetical protein
MRCWTGAMHEFTNNFPVYGVLGNVVAANEGSRKLRVSEVSKVPEFLHPSQNGSFALV